MEKYIHTIPEWKKPIMDKAATLMKEFFDYQDQLKKDGVKEDFQAEITCFLCLKIAQLDFELGRLWASAPSLLDNPSN